MGCSCKNVKKIQDSIINANGMNVERKGIKKVLYKIIYGLNSLWVKILVMLLIMVSIPFVFIILSFNLFFQGKPTIRLPKKFLKSLIKKNES